MSQKRDMGHPFSYELLRMIAAEERECFPTQTANARFGWGTHFRARSSGQDLVMGLWSFVGAPAGDHSMIEAPGHAVQQAGLLGFESAVGALDIEVELRRPADGGAALGVIALRPLGEDGLVARRRA